ncbi:hypothetical protein A3Q56_06900 [Intoshia linei]|uniref:Integrase catalytic domain-containing protein n=1 Tax=Intoshia linei TaxID=1819745 RepID=A0A177ATT2_9BILA|nr:hypothetical protein A3Q56_06900 [Intoshia linei]
MSIYPFLILPNCKKYKNAIGQCPLTLKPAFKPGLPNEIAKKRIQNHLGIRKCKTTSYHLECNGLAEHAVQQIKAGLHHFAQADDDSDWDDHLTSVLFAMRTNRSNSEHLIIHKHHDYFECGDFEIKIKWRNFKEYECLDINYEPNEYNINHFCKLKSNITYDEWIQQELEKDKISKVENFNLKDNVVNDRENEIDPLLRVY